MITPDKAVANCIQHDRSWLGDQLIGGDVASPPSGVTTESLRGRSTRQILHRYSGTGIDVFVAVHWRRIPTCKTAAPNLVMLKAGLGVVLCISKCDTV